MQAPKTTASLGLHAQPDWGRWKEDAAINSSQHINAIAAEIGGTLRWLQLWLICAAVRVLVDPNWGPNLECKVGGLTLDWRQREVPFVEVDYHFTLSREGRAAR